MSAMLDLTPETALHHGAVDDSPPPSERSQRGGGGVTSSVLLGVSVLLVWALVYLLVLSGLEQGRSQSALYQDLLTELSQSTVPISAPIEPGHPIALMSIPDAGVEDAVIVEGSRPEQLQSGPGHQLGTLLPGQVGVSVVAGRSLSFGAPFRKIDDLKPGDPIEVTTGQGTFTFRVLGVRREGDPAPPALEEGDARLILKTAWRRALSASQVLYVDADLTEGAAQPMQKSLPDEHASQLEMRAPTSTLAMLALSLQLLVGALAGFAWAWSRWSRRAAWVAIAPCVLGALWLSSSLGSRLLPGLV